MIIKRLPVAALALILYLVLSLACFGTLGDYRRMYLGSGDPEVYIWCLNWWPWAIAHGLNPFVSYYVWYPSGFNMTWANSMPAAALLMWPVTALTNAAFSFNLLSLTAPALAAWTAFLLARYLTRDTGASLIGGYLFGFSSYELGQMLGHLNLDVIFVVPLLVLLVVQRVRGDLSRWTFIAALAAALLFQLGLATELLATVCFFGAITWLIFFTFAAPKDRRRLWLVAGEIMVSSVIMAVLATPFLYYVLKDLKDVPADIHSPEQFSADLLNYLIPTEVTRVGGGLFRKIARQFVGNAAEQNAYLGLPLLLILLLQFRETLHRPYLKPLLLTWSVILVASLGPRLQIGGVATKFTLPWRWALHLPLIHQALPCRFSMYVALAAALAAAFWLSTYRGRWDRARRFTLGLVACLFLLPNTGRVRHWTPLSFHPFFEPQNVDASLGRNANVILLPFGFTGPGMVWQLQSGMRFTQSGGYVSFTPQSELGWWQVILNLYFGSPGPDFENDISAFCMAHQVSAVIAGPGTDQRLITALDALHWPTTNDHGVRLVRVPEARFLHFHRVSGDYWPGPDSAESWMGRQIKIVTHGCPVRLRVSGRYRPPELGPVEIRVANGTEESSYHITSPDAWALLTIPADASVTVTASSTFVPAEVLRNGDQRNLSVVFSLQPETE